VFLREFGGTEKIFEQSWQMNHRNDSMD